MPTKMVMVPTHRRAQLSKTNKFSPKEVQTPLPQSRARPGPGRPRLGFRRPLPGPGRPRPKVGRATLQTDPRTPFLGVWTGSWTGPLGRARPDSLKMAENFSFDPLGLFWLSTAHFNSKLTHSRSYGFVTQ